MESTKKLEKIAKKIIKGSRKKFFADLTAEERAELKKILIKYSPVDTNRTKLNALLYQIYDCEKELDAHCKAEDYIFVPAVHDLKEKILHEG